MINKIIFIIFICYYLIGQVAPYKLPYDINNHYVWEKTYNFSSEQRVVVKFDLNECLDELYLINTKNEFSGPYNPKIVNKTNPFKAKHLTIQVLSSSDCEIDDYNFIIEEYHNDLERNTSSNIF